MRERLHQRKAPPDRTVRPPNTPTKSHLRWSAPTHLVEKVKTAAPDREFKVLSHDQPEIRARARASRSTKRVVPMRMVIFCVHYAHAGYNGRTQLHCTFPGEFNYCLKRHPIAGGDISSRPRSTPSRVPPTGTQRLFTNAVVTVLLR